MNSQQSTMSLVSRGETQWTVRKGSEMLLHMMMNKYSLMLIKIYYSTIFTLENYILRN
jgi:hypothetical protein